MFGGHGHSHSSEEQQAAMQRMMSLMRNMQTNAANNGDSANMPPFNMTGPPTPQMMQMAQEYLKKQMEAHAANGTGFQMPAIPMGFNNKKSDTSSTDSNKIICKQETANMNAAVAQDDFSKADIVKATQYGVFDRCQEIIESGYDVNKPDSENVYLLHWAAINNHIKLAQYYIDKGAVVDVVGGELESTPLHWAARHGHVKMVILLMNNGANPLLYDNEGFAVIHLATMYSHSSVVAYLLAKGIDDKKGNTSMHYCVQFGNAVVLRILLDKGASMDIKNGNGLNPLQMAREKGKTNIAFLLTEHLNDDKNNLPQLLKPISTNKNIRKLFTQLFPLFTLFYFGLVLNSNIWFVYKAIMFLKYGLIYKAFKILFFDRNVTKYSPVATTFALIFWSYATWFIYFWPTLYTLLFAIATLLSWYNLYKAWKTNPGIVVNSREQVNKSIIKYLEHSEITLDQFCTSCVVRKPLRSKHCSECDHCVSKFDHHCPWVDNCIGQLNLKYFIGFLLWTPICLGFFIDSSMKFYNVACSVDSSTDRLDVILKYLQCSPWVAFFTCIACLNAFWITCLFISHLYQAVFAAMTTNERMNMYRYKHFTDKNGQFTNPFDFGILQNFIDVFEIHFGPFKPTTVNWLKVQDLNDLPSSKTSRFKDDYVV